MEIPKDFYTTTTLFSLTGSATAVWIITSVFGYLLEPKDSKKIKKWLGLILSLALALIGVTEVTDRTGITWVVAVVNGFLIYLTAVGANTIVGQGDSGNGTSSPMKETSAVGQKQRGRFTEQWWS